MKKTVMLIAILGLSLLIACSDEEEVQYPNPYDAAEEFMNQWMDENFETIYEDHFSEETKEAFTYDDYVVRHEHLYDVLHVENLNISFASETEPISQEDLELLTAYEIPIHISFQTLAGEVEFENLLELTRPLPEEEEADEEANEQQEDRWYVNWDTTFILPGLGPNDEVRYQSTPGERGDIIDRNGNPIATTGEVYEIGLTPMDFDEANLQSLANILGVSPASIQNQYEQSWVQEDHYVPIKKFMLNDEETVNEAVTISGVTSRTVIDRIYPYQDALGHLTGYIGPVTAEDLERLADEGYSSADVVGKRGLEQLYESELRGQDGVELYIEKEDGSKEVITTQDAAHGEDIQVTIDAELQAHLYEILEEEKGTATTIHPGTGEVTSLISLPSFDPNDFVLGMTEDQYTELSNDPDQPLINRFSATYSPGSTMKLLTSIAGFNTGVLDPTEVIEIEGRHWQKDEWNNYRVTRVSENHTEIDFETGFKFSDNIYFAMLGTEIGGDALQSELEALGFGESIPFEYPITASQITNSGVIDSEPQLADTSYGQGEVLMSIVHLTSIYAGIANDGNVQRPLLLTSESEEVWLEGIVDDQNLELLQDALRKVVSEGTATSGEVDGKAIAGKTGTAELKSSHEDDNDEQNGLFISYDSEQPNLVLGILLESIQDEGGSGYVVGKAKEFYETYSE